MKTISLTTKRDSSVMEALLRRASASGFTSTQLEIQDLSDLLWAANGINRPDEMRRTVPSAQNAQDIDIYVFMEAGTYLYDAARHQLELVVAGDNRGEFTPTGGTVPALVCLLVSDISRFTMGDESQRREWGAVDAGTVSQNISVFCAGSGLATRPRAGGMDRERLITLLQLSGSQIPLLNQQVSYPVSYRR